MVRDTFQRTRRLMGGVCLFGALASIAGCTESLRRPSHAPPAVASAPAAPTTTDAKYIGANAIDIGALLPAPLDSKSQETRAFELALADGMKSLATPAARERAAKDEGTAVWMFGAVLSREGREFTQENFPRAAAMLRQASADADRIKNLAKARFARERPGVGEVQPRSERVAGGGIARDGGLAGRGGPETYSYPSGHAVRAAVHARLLAQVAPECEIELLREAWFYCHSRLARGAHLASDVVAGLVVGVAIADDLLY
jgi:acid phosphatase (class A)